MEITHKEESCKIHNKKLKVFCQTCDCILCWRCAFKDHSSHTTQFIDEYNLTDDDKVKTYKKVILINLLLDNDIQSFLSQLGSDKAKFQDSNLFKIDPQSEESVQELLLEEHYNRMKESYSSLFLGQQLHQNSSNACDFAQMKQIERDLSMISNMLIRDPSQLLNNWSKVQDENNILMKSFKCLNQKTDQQTTIIKSVTKVENEKSKNNLDEQLHMSIFKEVAPSLRVDSAPFQPKKKNQVDQMLLSYEGESNIFNHSNYFQGHNPEKIQSPLKNKQYLSSMNQSQFVDNVFENCPTQKIKGNQKQFEKVSNKSNIQVKALEEQKEIKIDFSVQSMKTKTSSQESNSDHKESDTQSQKNNLEIKNFNNGLVEVLVYNTGDQNNHSSIKVYYKMRPSRLAKMLKVNQIFQVTKQGKFFYRGKELKDGEDSILDCVWNRCVRICI